MFFTKQDRAKLDLSYLRIKAVAQLLEAVAHKISIMPTRAELDQALSRENQDVEDAIQRWQDQLKASNDAHAQALADLQAKIDSGDDFSAEIQTLNETHNRIQQLAATPVSQIINPPPSAVGVTTGAAGATVGGAEQHDAAVAAGGTAIEGQGDHPGSIPTPTADASADKAPPPPPPEGTTDKAPPPPPPEGPTT